MEQIPPWSQRSASDENEIAAEQAIKRPAGNPKWVKGGPSPWPRGRPKGSTPQSKLMQRMLANADGIADAVIARALEGDTGAASLILSRIIPALKAQSQRVEFEFDPSASASRQVEQILEAIAGGSVAPDVGKMVIDAVGALSGVRATEQIEARITALEEKQR